MWWALQATWRSWFRLECCVLSELDFESAGSSVVRHCQISYLLWGHWVAVNMTWHSLVVLNTETLERAHSLLFGRFVRCSSLGWSFTGLWYIQMYTCTMIFSIPSHTHTHTHTRLHTRMHARTHTHTVADPERNPAFEGLPSKILCASANVLPTLRSH